MGIENPTKKDGITTGEQEKIRFAIETFVFNPQKPEEVDLVAQQMHTIDQERFPGASFFTLELFKEVLVNTAANETNKGKTNTVVLIQKEKDSSIFGFTYAEPAENVYNNSPDENTRFFPERLNNPDLEFTAYITNTVFKESGYKLISEAMQKLEEELRKKGYKFIERDATTNFNYAENIKKKYAAKIMTSEEHDSPLYGRQVFFRIKI